MAVADLEISKLDKDYLNEYEVSECERETFNEKTQNICLNLIGKNYFSWRNVTTFEPYN